MVLAGLISDKATDTCDSYSASNDPSVMFDNDPVIQHLVDDDD